MPLYDFKCHDCNHQFTHLALPPVKEPLEITCPSCESSKVQKLLSAPNVTYKGKGFYTTDSKDAAPKPPVDARK